MIITRAPFRVTLGGGGTDLPSYYKEHCGFIFSFTINKYMYINVNRPVVDNLIRVKYSDSETVKNLDDLKHDLARECLRKTDINNRIEISSMADIPAGSGLGSSSTYTVGLLHALHNLKRDFISLKDLAEEACKVEIDILKKPMGKQDQYLAAFGGFLVLEISRDGFVEVSNAKINNETIDALRKNLKLFYTGVHRKNHSILKSQDQSTIKSDKKVLNSLHYIKNSGHKILDIVESGNINKLGEMFDEHWEYKKKLSEGITNKKFDRIYEIAKNNGALGGKISGAGGGGFFTFYCENNHAQLTRAMAQEGLRELRYDFDFTGSRVQADLSN